MSSKSGPIDKLGTLRVKWLTLALFFFLFYAIMRYIVFKGVNPVQIPLYIVNKVFSITGLFFLATSYAFGKLTWLRFKDATRQNQFIKFTGLAGFSLSAMHVFNSLVLLSPSYYPKIYDGEMMNLTGELTMLMGVFSLYCFTIPAITTIPFMQEAVGIKKWQQGQRLGYFGLFTALLHTSIMGFKGWLDIQTWPGYLPPITLIGAVIAIVPLYLKFLRRT